MVDVLQYTGIVQGELQYRVRREKHLGTAITIQLQQRIAMGAEIGNQPLAAAFQRSAAVRGRTSG